MPRTYSGWAGSGTNLEALARLAYLAELSQSMHGLSGIWDDIVEGTKGLVGTVTQAGADRLATEIRGGSSASAPQSSGGGGIQLLAPTSEIPWGKVALGVGAVVGAVLLFKALKK